MATFATCTAFSSSYPFGPVSDQQFSGVVLLVEDEPLVRLVTAEILLEANFRVIEAGDASEALRVLNAEVAVDVLLSDVEMPPGMNGYELARHVHQHRPEVGILISSGREWPKESDLPPGAAFLPKPYPNAKLVSRVQAAALKAQEARRLRHDLRDDQAAGSIPETVPKTA
ncbi:response regulator [Microvirga sp. BT689]|uniref:response regulator n=1 Tax=Microvirga arvi TaxID=2778731 RepID=UPI001951A22A|nr:response regulator [Microvirga arvi]MBM6581990.1 response regulator [Microvirga arvi]